MKGLILSGGHGTRLRPLTYSQQKQLIPIANKPILFYAIEDVLACGVRDVGIVVGPNADQVERTVRGADWSRWGDVRFEFIHQGDPKGLAHAVKVARPFLGDDSFVMYLGDNLLKGGIVSHCERFVASGAHASIMLTPVPDPTKFGVAELDDKGHIVRLVEKPKHPPTNLALVGIYFFTPAIHEGVDAIAPSWRNELEITDAIQWLVARGRRVLSARVDGWWKDTGLPGDMIDANALVLDDVTPSNAAAEVAPTAVIKGRVAIGKGTRILGRTVLKGPVVIGENCVLEDAYVGPYTTIGPGTTVRRTEIEDSIVLEGCTLDECGRLVESLIGRGVKVQRSVGAPRGHRLVVGDDSEIALTSGS